MICPEHFAAVSPEGDKRRKIADHVLVGPSRPSAACSAISQDSSIHCFLDCNGDALSIKAPSQSYSYQASASICSTPTSAKSDGTELPDTPRATSMLNISNSYFDVFRNNNQYASPSVESRRESRRGSHSLLSRPPMPSRPSAKRRLFSSDASDQAPAAVANIFHALPSLRIGSNAATPLGLLSMKPIATTYAKQDGKTQAPVSFLGLSAPALTFSMADAERLIQVPGDLLQATPGLVPASPVASRPCAVGANQEITNSQQAASDYQQIPESQHQKASIKQAATASEDQPSPESQHQKAASEYQQTPEMPTASEHQQDNTST
eukprot:gene13809-19725_t